MNTKHINTLIAALAVAGVGLLAFVIGVNGGTEAETPPGPDSPPAVEREVPPSGVDQRLYELADKYAERMEAQQQPGPDQRLYELADRFAAEQRR